MLHGQASTVLAIAAQLRPFKARCARRSFNRGFMIVSASRRTDIPHYYSEWFINRVRAGCALVRNPMNRAQLSRVPLAPDLVDCIVFWTKDPENLLPYLPELDRLGYVYGFQFTLTPYGREIEPGLRDKADIKAAFIELSKRIGRERVVWRYDPIILNAALGVDYHKYEFARLCESLAAYADAAIISFADIYPKLRTDALRKVSDSEVRELAAFIGETAQEHGLRVSACCEEYELSRYGIEKTGCIQRPWLERICGCSLSLSKDKGQRAGCLCAESADIGAYDTCPAGCVYCYANGGGLTAQRRWASHKPNSKLLCGEPAPGEVIKDRRARSNKIR